MMSLRKMSRRVFGAGIILTGVLILGAALIIGLQFPKFVYDTNLEHLCIVNVRHPGFDDWVHDVYREKINRIYYWHITNKEDVLYNNATPNVTERGPYVYREVETKLEVRFVSKQIKFYPWRRQYFDAELTKTECPDCTETDNITIINQYYFEQVSRRGGDYQYAFYNTPSTVSNALRAITALSGERSVAMTQLGKLSARYTDRWQPYLGTAPGTTCFSFGCWVWLNDTDDKSSVLASRDIGAEDFTAEEMAGLYDALTDGAVFGDPSASSTTISSQCQTYDEPPSNRTLYPIWVPSQLPAAGLVACLQMFAQLRTLASDQLLLNITQLVSAYLCRNKTNSCLNLPTDIHHRFAYVGVISDYVLTSVAGYVLFKSLIEAEEFVETKPQCRWALGTCLVGNDTEGQSSLPRGILDHAKSESEALATAKQECLLNCYDKTFAETNMMWKAYDHRDRASPEQFPRASDEARLILSRRYNLMPAPNLSACATYDLQRDAYEFFHPDFWRRLSYVRGELTSLHGVKLRRLLFNRSNLDTDHVFVFEQGIQDMSGTYNYTCSVCLPHFQYADPDIIKLYATKPTEQYHRPYVDVEPVTGEVWRQAWRYQYNIGINQRDISVPRTERLQVNHTDIPTPVYWLEQSFTYTQEGKDDYHERVGRLLNTSCGGMISLCVISGLIIITGLLSATISIRGGHIAPIQDEPVTTY